MQLTYPGIKNLSKNISKNKPFSCPNKVIPYYIPGDGIDQFMSFSSVLPYLPATYGSDGIACTSEADYLQIASVSGSGANAGSYRTDIVNFRYIDHVYVRVYADGDLGRIIDYGAMAVQNSNGSGNQYGIAQKIGAGWVRIDLRSITASTVGYVHAYLVTDDTPGTSLVKICSAYAVIADDTPEPAI